METRKVKYNGNYPGIAQKLTWHPNEVKEVPLEVAEKLIDSGQFTVVEAPKKKEEPPTTEPEVKDTDGEIPGN